MAPMDYINIVRLPDHVSVHTDVGTHRLALSGALWQGTSDVQVSTRESGSHLAVEVIAPQSLLQNIHLRWNAGIEPAIRILGDAWERGYGDLEWRGLVPERPLPWYFLMNDGEKTHGYGVRTAPAAFCFWRVDDSGFSLETWRRDCQI